MSPDKDGTRGLEHAPSLRELAATLSKPKLWGNYLAHLLVFIPGAVFIGIMARRLDRIAGLEPLLDPPWSILVAAICFLAGATIVGFSYGYLYLMGLGSPGVHMGHTRRLVDTGIFSLVRHPSVLGKLIGVIGLAVLMRSASFLLVIIPLLFLYSYVTTRYIQDHYCRKNFGEEWEDYCRRVPMYIPRWGQVREWIANRRGQ